LEIGAIPGIRALNAVRGRPAEIEPPAIFDIDGSAKPGDGIVQRSGRKAAGAEEDVEDDLFVFGETEPGDAGTSKNVDYFA
jgi:hypothetical protein